VPVLTPEKLTGIVKEAALLATVRHTIVPAEYFMSWIDTVTDVEARAALTLKGEVLHFIRNGEISIALDSTSYNLETTFGTWHRFTTGLGPDLDGIETETKDPLVVAIRRAMQLTDQKKDSIQ